MIELFFGVSFYKIDRKAVGGNLPNAYHLDAGLDAV